MNVLFSILLTLLITASSVNDVEAVLICIDNPAVCFVGSRNIGDTYAQGVIVALNFEYSDSGAEKFVWRSDTVYPGTMVIEPVELPVLPCQSRLHVILHLIYDDANSANNWARRIFSFRCPCYLPLVVR